MQIQLSFMILRPITQLSSLHCIINHVHSISLSQKYQLMNLMTLTLKMLSPSARQRPKMQIHTLINSLRKSQLIPFSTLLILRAASMNRSRKQRYFQSSETANLSKAMLKPRACLKLRLTYLQSLEISLRWGKSRRSPQIETGITSFQLSISDDERAGSSARENTAIHIQSKLIKIFARMI